MFGGFHYAKILPQCNGCYISNSGMDDAVIKSRGFQEANPDLNSHRKSPLKVKAKQNTLMIVKVTYSLILEVFFLAIDTQLN